MAFPDGQLTFVGDVYPFKLSYENPETSQDFIAKTDDYCAIVNVDDARWHRHNCDEEAIAVCVLQ